MGDFGLSRLKRSYGRKSNLLSSRFRCSSVRRVFQGLPVPLAKMHPPGYPPMIVSWLTRRDPCGRLHNNTKVYVLEYDRSMHNMYHMHTVCILCIRARMHTTRVCILDLCILASSTRVQYAYAYIHHTVRILLAMHSMHTSVVCIVCILCILLELILARVVV